MKISDDALKDMRAAIPSDTDFEGGDNLIVDFLKSGISSNAELFGFDAFDGVREYRRKHPIGGLASEFMGLSVPYLGIWKATKKISSIDKMIKKITNPDASIIGRAGEEMLRIAPLEVAAAGSRIANDQDVSESLSQGAINLGISGGFGAVAGIVASVGKVQANKLAASLIDQNASSPMKLRALRAQKDTAIKEKMEQKVIDQIDDEIVNMREKVRAETPRGGTKDADGKMIPGAPLTDGIIQGNSGIVSKKGQGSINKLFNVSASSTKHLTTKQLVIGDGGFKHAEDLLAVETKFGIKENFEEFAQFPRHRKFLGTADEATKSARNTWGTVRDNFTPASLDGQAGKDVFFVKEPGNGTYLMAIRKAGKPNPDKGVKPAASHKDDEWLFFKTDTPHEFVPRGGNYSEKMLQVAQFQKPFEYSDLSFADKALLHGQTDPMKMQVLDILNNHAIGGSQFNQTRTFLNMHPIFDTFKLKSKDAGTKLAEVLGIADKEVAMQVRRVFQRYFTPAMFQFKDNALATKIYNVGRFASEQGQRRAQIAMAGLAKVDGALSAAFKGPKTQNAGNLTPMTQLIDKLSGKDLEALHFIWRTNKPVAHARQWMRDNAKTSQLGIMSPELEQFLDTAAIWDGVRMTELMAMTRLKTGGGPLIEPVTPNANHYGIARTWEGEYRTLIRNRHGDVVWVADGKNQAIANKRAAEAIKDLEEKLGIKRSDDFTLEDFTSETKFKGSGLSVSSPNRPVNSRQDDLDLLHAMNSNSEEFKVLAGMTDDAWRFGNRPAHMKDRTGAGGFAGEKTPFTQDELKKIMGDHGQAVERHLSDKTTEYLVRDMMVDLVEQDRHMADMVKGRLDDLALRQGPVGMLTNRLSDQLLGNIVGKNSATKIVAAANQGMFHWMLGMGNMAFSAVNTLTTLVTTLPQAAYAMGANPLRLNNIYTTIPIIMNGKVNGTMSFLEPAKMVGRGYKRMKLISKEGSLEKKFAERGANEGMWAPRFVETHGGENATEIAKIREGLKSGKDVARWLGAVSGAAPAFGERFTRLHSLMTGMEIGQRIHKLTNEDDLYQFAKEFTNNSMFLYSTADRAKILSGPMGSGLGLFKNWQMHQMFWMAEYFGEGAKGALGKDGTMAPLLWAIMGTGAVGGIGALPAVGAADMASRWLADKSLMQLIYDNFADPQDQTLADSLWLGLPSLLGFSMQAQNTAPFANPARDVSQLMSFVYADRAKAVGQAVSGAYTTMFDQGNHPADSGEVRLQLMKALAPKTFFNASQALGTGAIRSWRTGNKLVDGMSYSDQFMYSVGFTPKEVEKKFAVNNELWNDQNRMRELVAGYGSALAEAAEDSRWDEFTQLIRDGSEKGVDVGSMMNSYRARLQRRAEPQIERQFQPTKVFEFKNTGVTLG